MGSSVKNKAPTRKVARAPRRLRRAASLQGRLPGGQTQPRTAQGPQPELEGAGFGDGGGLWKSHSVGILPLPNATDPLLPAGIATLTGTGKRKVMATA